jgi:hypothetical protein
MTASRNPDRLIHAFLNEGEELLRDQVYDAVRADIDHRAQRVVIGPWRFPVMNKILGFGLAAAAVVVAVLIGSQLIGSPATNVGGPGDEPSPTPEASVVGPTPESTPTWTGIAEGPYVVTNTEDSPVQVTVDITAPGWAPLAGVDAVTKNDDGLDAPQTEGGALLAWAWPAGTEFAVYGDPCQWATTAPETSATTPDEIAAAFASQAQTEASPAVDVTIGGYAGKAVTLQVPLTYEVEGATREEEFAACDESVFAYYGSSVDGEVARNAQGPGEFDELWILDVDGVIVILNAVYGPETPGELVDEMRVLAESATFEVP